MQQVTKVYNLSYDFFISKNARLFLGKGSYAHLAKFIASLKTASSALTKYNYKKQAQNILQG